MIGAGLVKSLRTGLFCLPFLLATAPAGAGEGAASPDFVEEVYLTPDEAVQMVFPAGETVRPEEITLSPQQVRRVERRAGWRLERTTFTVYRGWNGSEPSGFAVITEEIGKFKPVTFIVKVTAKGRVEAVEIMVYREAVGREVRRKRFLRQFRRKTAQSPLRINRDIINITGATLSVRAISAGVKRVLCVLDEVYGLSSASQR